LFPQLTTSFPKNGAGLSLGWINRGQTLEETCLLLDLSTLSEKTWGVKLVHVAGHRRFTDRSERLLVP